MSSNHARREREVRPAPVFVVDFCRETTTGVYWIIRSDPMTQVKSRSLPGQHYVCFYPPHRMDPDCCHIEAARDHEANLPMPGYDATVDAMFGPSLETAAP